MSKFVVLPLCAHGVILEMVFLYESSASIDLHERIISLLSRFPKPEESGANKRAVDWHFAMLGCLQDQLDCCQGKPIRPQTPGERKMATLT